ncbi:MocR-like pyridoxine biosynthesis transcription factor PdxR [Peristeroidobacter agariperforans]|uniref:MocR-like pyridoxine biosynthesis transcription factor PdxR n=1 Tax=Peristeroidobacter agariperforans TaxID=268404 RepID=UPI00101E225B
MPDLRIELDRGRAMPLATQIYGAIRDAIESGRLASGAKLPSWQDLASQLGVSRGTVRSAYERLMDEQFAIGMGAAGTRVAERPASSSTPDRSAEGTPVPELFHDFGTMPLTFQMGVPSQAAFPFKLWSRMLTRASRAAAAAPVSYPDPRGEPELRKEIAGYLAIARGLHCKPSQILITSGFSGALGVVLRTLQLEGKEAWMEDPGFPLTRTALRFAGMSVTGVPVDAEGLDVNAGIQRAPGAALAITTPGQHAPLGMTMSLARRLALLEWAGRNDAWIIEDDYLSELQLQGRAAPALASLDHQGRVLHIGSFSKTISPALRLGFVVFPSPLASKFADVAASLAPAPSATVQRAVTAFLREGHYLRHLRRMKRLYHAQRESLLRCLRDVASDTVTVQASAGLAIVTSLPRAVSDVDVALRALLFGLAPTPLSPWSIQSPPLRGLLLGVTNLDERRLAADCRRLVELAEQADPGR